MDQWFVLLVYTQSSHFRNSKSNVQFRTAVGSKQTNTLIHLLKIWHVNDRTSCSQELPDLSRINVFISRQNLLCFIIPDNVFTKILCL